MAEIRKYFLGGSDSAAPDGHDELFRYDALSRGNLNLNQISESCKTSP